MPPFMAPAALDSQSPLNSNQNPNFKPVFPPFSSSTSADDGGPIAGSVLFGNASESNMNAAAAHSRFGSRRNRPRLVKVRKQLHERSKGVSAVSGVGLNPFQSVCETSSSGNGCATSSNVHCPSVNFVFGASSSCSVPENLDSKQRSFDLNVDELSSKEQSANLESVNFVFGDGHKHLSGDEEKAFPKDSEGLQNAGTGFSSKLWQSSENQSEPASNFEDGKTCNPVFVFGGTGNNVERKSGTEKSRQSEFDSGPCNMGKVSLRTDDEHKKNDVIGLEKGEPSGTAVESNSDNVGFIFGGTPNNSRTNISNSAASYIFGASWFNLNDNKESSGNFQNFVADQTSKIKMEGTAANGANNASNAFHSADNCKEDDGKVRLPFDGSYNCKNSSMSTEYAGTNCSDQLKSTSECYRTGYTQNDSVCASFDAGCELASDQSSSDVAGACSKSSVFNLSDSLNKLNIDYGTDAIYSLKDDAAFFNDAFNFGSNGSASLNAAVFEPTTPGLNEDVEKGPTNTFDKSGKPFTDFKTPNWDPSSLKASLFPDVNENLEFSVKGRPKHRKSKTMRRKWNQLSRCKIQGEQGQVECKGSEQGALSSSECYSPMDFSPYEDTVRCSESNTDCTRTDAGVASGEDASGVHGESNRQIQFEFASGLENIDERKFSFSASSSMTNKVSARRRLHRRKNRLNANASCEPFVIPACPFKDEGDLSTSQGMSGNHAEANVQFKQSFVSSTTAVEEVCEVWRLRGNQAYQNGELLKAEGLYTHGIKSVPSSVSSGSCLRALAMCYSNRAATRMSLGNLREALGDCTKATALDPKFLKVQMRAANCHLILGETEEARQYFSKCLASGDGVCLDRRMTIQAADGLQKLEKVVIYADHAAKLLEQWTSDAALSALEVIAEAITISPYSERLLEMKAKAMFMARKYEEVIQLCEQTLFVAEKNLTSSGTHDLFKEKNCSETECLSFPRLWRWHLISKCYFYLGKLETALDLLEKLEKSGSAIDKDAKKIMESSISLSAIIRSLIHHKSAGNEAVRSGKYTEALEHYTASIASNIESRPFAAICFCNRAAAHQALGQITDAIADCSLAIALDGNYQKAVSRRATLHEMIRDYGQAAIDLQRVISILEKQSDGKTKQSGTPGSRSSSTKELRQAKRRLSLMEEESKKDTALDLYLILGVKWSDSAADIKRAYRKAALKHHPDKAGQFLARSESGDEGQLWKDIVQEVHSDADRSFKMIGEAYAVLSDPKKRLEYDADEEIRKALKEEKEMYQSRNSQCYSNGRRNWPDNWKTYGYSRSRW